MTPHLFAPRPLKLSVKIDYLVKKHYPAVLAIAKQCAGDPWTSSGLQFFQSGKTNVGLVAIANGTVVGFLCFTILKERYDLVDLAIDEDYQRRGIAEQLIDRMKYCLDDAGRVSITMDVRETDLPMQLFMRKHRFFADGVIRDCFDDTGEAGYRFVYSKESA